MKNRVPSAVAYFREVLLDPWQAAKSWKARTGGAVIGWLPADVPEELVLAAGALPVVVRGGRDTASLADAHLQVWACSFARSSLELGLRGDLSFLDGMIIPQICDTTRNLYGIWQQCFPGLWVHPYLLPRQVERDSAARYLRAEMGRLASALAELTGTEITEERLGAACDLTFRCRRLLNAVYEWHAAHPEALTNEDLYTVLWAAGLLPKEDLAAALDALVRELGIDGEAEAEPEGEGGRVFLSGSLAAPAGIFALLERAGLAVVGDDLHDGYRYVHAPRTVPADPWQRLVERQLSLPPTGFLNRRDPDRRDYLLGEVRRRRAQGVIFLHLRFCEPENYDYPDLNAFLAQNGVPVLRLETDFQGASAGQIATRLEAFAEMLGGGIDA